MDEPRSMDEKVKPQTHEPIAIVGLACRFPGAENPEQFWNLLCEGGDAIQPTPKDRPQLIDAYDKDPDAPGKTGTRWGGFLSDIVSFDASFFNISPREAARIDPQQRLVLQVAWEALENSAIAPEDLRGKRVGVFIGASSYDFGRLLARDPTLIDGSAGAGAALSIVSNRLSYALDLHGPSLTIDTACSSSLVAVHMACQSLRIGDCELALVGGVNLLAAAEPFIAFSKARMMALDGRCKSFDDRADGYVRGEGCGVVVLQLTSVACAAGNTPLAFVLGSAINHDGLTNGLTAPNPGAQTKVIQEACRHAGIRPAALQYVEAHGTGTALGDPIEVSALAAAIGPRSAQPEFPESLLLGSVKSNIGHLEAAAGIAGLIKCALALYHGYLPKSLHIEKPNHLIPFENLPIALVREGQAWPENGSSRFAGVSSFGFGGTNAHVVMRAPKGSDGQPEHRRFRSAHLLCLSAKNEESLTRLAQRYSAYLGGAANLPIGDICRTANSGRSHHRHRLAVKGKSVSDLKQGVDRFLHQSCESTTLSGIANQRAPKVAFLFSGQGTQFPGMCHQLYDESAVFRTEIDRVATFLERKQPGFNLKAALFTPRSAPRLNQTAYAQPALFAVEIALDALWRSWGIEPVALCGHSLGEYVAAYVAGIYSFEDALNFIYERGQLMQSLPRDGAMAAVQLGEAELQKRIADSKFRSRISLAAVNAPRSCTISGEANTIGNFVEKLKSEGVHCVALRTSHAFHSPLIEPMLDDLDAIAQNLETGSSAIPIALNATGSILPKKQKISSNYWRKQSVGTVRFADCLERLQEIGATVLLEIGPDASLSTLAYKTLGRRDTTVLASLRRDRDDWQTLFTALGTLYIQGSAINWHEVDHDYGMRRLFLPTYAFRDRRHWLWSEPDCAGEGIDMSRQQHELTEGHANRASRIEMKLRRLLSEVLEMEAGEIDSRTPFSELCADSVLLMELVARLESSFDVEISGRQLYEEVLTLDDLVAFLDANIPSNASTSGKAFNLNDSNDRQLSNVAGEPAALPYAEHSGVSDQTSDIMKHQLDMLYRVIDRQLATFNAQPAAAGSSGSTVRVNLPQSSVQPASDNQQEADDPETAPVVESFGPAWKAETVRLIEAGNTVRGGSKSLASTYRGVLADPRGVAGFRAPLKELLYPIVGVKAKGARLWDVDGNEYIDLTMGFGALLFGHDPVIIREAIEKQLASGLLLGPQAKHAGEVAALITGATGMPRVVFCTTGTEAVMLSLRLARRATGRSEIVQFTGAYHGHFDGTLAMPSPGYVGRPLAPGISPGAASETHVLPYGDRAALEYIRERANEIAAVIVEPVQSRHPELQPQEFLKELRSLTEENGIALIFDEIITGFRTAPGGAQAWFDVRADMAVYGKALGGGLPIGAVAGYHFYLDGVDGGEWCYGDDTTPKESRTFFAGTYNKHPLSMAAAHAVLTELKRQGGDFQARLNAETEALAERLNTLFNAHNAPLRVDHFASFFRFAHTQNLDLFYHELLDQGLYIWEGRTCFLSAAHKQTEIEEIVKRVERTTTKLFDEPTSTVACLKPAPKSTGDVLRPPSEGAELPVIEAGSLCARFTKDPSEIEAALTLRYDVFVREVGSKGISESSKLDRDEFDDYCDHLVVWEKEENKVVATYRLIDEKAAARVGRFYSSDEFDLAPLVRRKGKLLELGRACVAPKYRNGDSMNLLWSAIAAYVRAKGISTLFGCASLHGSEPADHAEILAYLHRYHLAPPELRVTALPHRRAKLDLDSIILYNRRAVQATLPPLFKGYLRMGAVVGDGAVVDKAFNTVDVAMILYLAALGDKKLDAQGFHKMELI